MTKFLLSLSWGLYFCCVDLLFCLVIFNCFGGARYK